MQRERGSERGVQQTGGAILLISHDRHLLANNVDQFLLVENGSILEFDGDLNDYSLRILKNLNKSHASKSTTHKESTPGAQRQLDQKKIKQLKNEIHAAEKRLKRLQEKIAGVEGILQSPETYDGDFQDDLHDLIRNQTELKTEIEEVEQRWLNLNEQLEGNS